MNLFKPQIAPTYRLKPQKMPFFKKNTEGLNLRNETGINLKFLEG
jgi:hypothetical protein